MQSSGGVIVPPEGYLPRLKEMCEARGMLLILDEAQTAFGRLGANFAFEHLRRGAGFPDRLEDARRRRAAGGDGAPPPRSRRPATKSGFLHVTSHVSDPLPAAVGLAVLDVLEEERLAERALEMGAHLKAGLRDLQQRYEVIGDVRGRGLLWGVELVNDRHSREPDPELGGRSRGAASSSACR